MWTENSIEFQSPPILFGAHFRPNENSRNICNFLAPTCGLRVHVEKSGYKLLFTGCADCDLTDTIISSVADTRCYWHRVGSIMYQSIKLPLRVWASTNIMRLSPPSQFLAKHRHQTSFCHSKLSCVSHITAFQVWPTSAISHLFFFHISVGFMTDSELKFPVLFCPDLSCQAFLPWSPPTRPW